MFGRTGLMILAALGGACSTPQPSSTPGATQQTPAAPSTVVPQPAGTSAIPAPPATAGATGSSGPATIPTQPPPTAAAGAGQAAPAAGTGSAGAGDAAAGSTSAAGSGPSAAVGCEPRNVEPSTGIHFHHIHFNTVDPDKDLDFYDKYFGAAAVPFCNDKDKKPLAQATKTERGWFLYTRVDTPPDMTLNTYLEHIGWISLDPAGELERLVALGAPRYPVGRAQCETAFDGSAPCAGYWFYLLAPSGARVEVALGPGPATSGYGHVHLVMGEDYAFFEKVTNGALQNQVIDGVNHTDASLIEDVLANETVVDTRGKPIDHIGYSTANLEAERDRIKAAGITIAEDITFKPQFGFRSFFVKSPKGTWLELVEDAQFDAAPP
jgi:catechol 2,3-dioxygenase-like lactoylglutathione lyase family enzyme